MRTRSSALCDGQAPDDADSDHRPKKRRRLVRVLMTEAARQCAPAGQLEWVLQTYEEEEDEEEDEEEEEEGSGECNNR
jgi:hypothetical protein